MRHLWFNNYAKGSLGGLYSLDPLEAGDKLLHTMQDNYMRAIADMVYCGLEGHYEAHGQEKDYTKSDILMWCAEIEEADAVQVFNTWVEASGIRQIIKQSEDSKKEAQGEEKKSDGMTSSISPSESSD